LSSNSSTGKNKNKTKNPQKNQKTKIKIPPVKPSNLLALNGSQGIQIYELFWIWGEEEKL
jgi:hypothetical protein